MSFQCMHTVHSTATLGIGTIAKPIPTVIQLIFVETISIHYQFNHAWPVWELGINQIVLPFTL